MHQDVATPSAAASTRAAARTQLPLLILYLLDAFVLGALAALLVVRYLLITTVERVTGANAATGILSVLDHLLPYYLVCGGALLVLALLTLVARLWQARTDVFRR